MTATYYNCKFVKDGVQVTVMVTNYKENYTKEGLKKIPSPLTVQNRLTDPDDVNYGKQNKSQIIDLGINPERRLTITGVLTNDSQYGDTHNLAIDKKNSLTKMFLQGGNIVFTYETGSVVVGTPFFQNVVVDKWEFDRTAEDGVTPYASTPFYGLSSGVEGEKEYSVTISMEDADEYGT